MGGADNNKIRAEQAMREQALRQQAEQSRKADMAAGRQRGEELSAETRLARLRVGEPQRLLTLSTCESSSLGSFPRRAKRVSLSGTGGIQQSTRPTTPAYGEAWG